MELAGEWGPGGACLGCSQASALVSARLNVPDSMEPDLCEYAGQGGGCRLRGAVALNILAAFVLCGIPVRPESSWQEA